MGKRSKQRRAMLATHKEMQVEEALHFNERDMQNYGKFVPFLVEYGHANVDADIRVNEYARKDLVNQSRYYKANLSEIKSAMARLADFTVGNAMVPFFNGTNQEWAETLKINYLKKALNNLTRLGPIATWQVLWKTILQIVIEDGDVLLIPYKDRYGMPKIDVVEGHRISTRDGTSTIKTGQFTGMTCEDGVIYDANNTVKGYYILGEREEDDYTISVANCILIYNPFSFYKGRGLPVLSSAARSARNLMDYQHYIPQIVKQEARVQLVETNPEGRAPVGRTAFSAYNSVVPINPAPNSQNINGATVQAVTEYTQAGVYYVKTNGGKLESFNSGRPTHEVQSYYTNTQKEMLSILFPHQLLLSPETVGGPGARGLKEILVAAIGGWRAMLENVASYVLTYVLSVAMTNNVMLTTFDITTNFKEDFTNWSFTPAPEPVIDAGQERAADLADYNAGLKSAGEIVAKDGHEYKDTLKSILNNNKDRAEAIRAFSEQYPELAKYAPQMFGLQEPKQATPDAQPSVKPEKPTDKTI